jgi:hypothetical protein
MQKKIRVTKEFSKFANNTEPTFLIKINDLFGRSEVTQAKEIIRPSLV